jgi:hypothetical protein
MLAAGLFVITVCPGTRSELAPHDPRILKMAKVSGASNKKAREFYETGAENQRLYSHRVSCRLYASDHAIDYCDDFHVQFRSSYG